jgi:hypothetical protein
MYLPTELEEGGWAGEAEGSDFVDRVKSTKSAAREDKIARDEEEADEDKEK